MFVFIKKKQINNKKVITRISRSIYEHIQMPDLLITRPASDELSG